MARTANPDSPLLVRLPHPRWTGLLLLVLAGWVLLRTQPPSPLADDADATVFSSERAAAEIAALLPESEPHPIGSEANLKLHERLILRLREAGLNPQTIDRTACRPFGRCGRVRNLLARIPGETDGPAVLLAVHYDSVAAGPGVSDDLSGVAVALEVARAIKAGPTPRRPIWILIDDGEEAGLLGARAFVDDPELVAGVGVVLNIEARGSGGLAHMFETSGPNAWMVDVASGAISRPSFSSLSVEIYRHMPNDTDLTVFREAGLPGMNFAFIRNLNHYHSPLDDLEHLDRGTLQHQGDGILAATRALADAPELVRVKDDAVYGDVLGIFVVSWPEALAWPMGLLGLLLAGAAGAMAIRRETATLGSLLLGLAAAIVIACLCVLGAFATGRLISALAHAPSPPSATPVWGLLCLVVLVGAISLCAAAILGSKRAVAAAVGAWILWAALGLAIALIAPGASLIFVLPALIGSSALLVSLATRRHLGVAGALGITAACAMVGVLTISLFDAFEFQLFPVLAVPLALVATTVSPGLCPSGPTSGPGRIWQPLRLRLGVAVGVFLLALLTASWAPQRSLLQPSMLNFIRVDDHIRDDAIWYAETHGGQPDLDGFMPADHRLPGLWGELQLKSATLEDPSPSEGARMVPLGGDRPGRYHLTSARGSTLVGLAFPKGLIPGFLRVDGHDVKPMALPWFDGINRGYVDVVGLPAAGVEIEIGLPPGALIELVDVAHGISGPEARGLKANRPPGWVPKHGGDRHLIVTSQRL